MADNGYLTIAEARDRLRQATTIVLKLEADYAEAVQHSADAEAVYRAHIADRVRFHRSAGEAATTSETYARADVVELSRERDVAAGLLKLAAEKLEDGRDSRRSLWRLIDWSKEHDRGASSGPENAPGERWP